MAYTAPITGYVNRLGYLHCSPCAEARDKTDGTPVHADNAAYYGECCDGCGHVFVRAARKLVAA